MRGLEWEWVWVRLVIVMVVLLGCVDLEERIEKVVNMDSSLRNENDDCIFNVIQLHPVVMVHQSCLSDIMGA